MSFDKALWLDFLVDVAASIFTGAVAVVAVYVWSWLSKRAQRRWMGMSGKKPGLQIYASNLTIKPAGAEPVEGEAVTVGFTGAAMNEKEYLSALKLRDSLRPPRIIEGVTELFRRRVEPMDVHVCPRKWDERKVPHSNLVFLGSPIYNSGTKHYLKGERVKFSLDADKRRVLLIDDQEYTRSSSVDDYGVIYRMNRNGRSIFICAGLGTEGTCEAANHLAVRWKEIREECQGGEFIALLKKNAHSTRPKITYEYKEVLERDREYSGPSQNESEQPET
ncbi:MAG TPA: hypothetical protein VN493_25495 [Thermoanaerobaculia bacterium]|nr:hypothetical protein [Thermoanaerobaculia bacterium]